MSRAVHVVLASHGAGDESEANRRVRVLAHEIEATMGQHDQRDQRDQRVRVVPAFALGAPSFAEAIVGAGASDVVVLPLLTSDGVHASRWREQCVRLRRAEKSGPGTPKAPSTILLAPIGTQSSFASALAAQIAQHASRIARHRRLRVLIVAHGTGARASSADAAYALVARVRQWLVERKQIDVRAAFLDQEPDIPTALRDAASTHDVYVVPFLLGGGAHADSDVSDRVRQALHGMGIAKRHVHFERALIEGDVLRESARSLIHETIARALRSA